MNRKKITLNEELARMSSLFRHMSIPSKLLVEQVTKSLDVLGLTKKNVDNLTKSGVDYIDDLSLLSKEFATLTGKANPTFDDLIALVKGGTDRAITDADITNYIKSNEKLYSDILNTAAKQSDEIVANLMKKTDILDLFKKAGSEDYFNTISDSLSIPITKNTAQDLKVIYDDILKTLDSIGKSGNNIPDSFKELQSQFNAKKADVDGFLNAKVGDDVNLGKNLPVKIDDIELKTFYDDQTKTVQKTATDWANNLSDNQAKEVLENMLKNKDQIMGVMKSSGNFERGVSGFERLLKIIPNVLGSFGDKKVLIGTIVVAGIFLVYYGYKRISPYFKGTEPIPVPDISLDTEDEDCVQEVVGYNNLDDNQKTYVAMNYGCKKKVKGFGKASNGNLIVIHLDDCKEVIKVDSDGVSGSVISTNCNSNPEDETNPIEDENPNEDENPSVTYTNDLDGWQKYAGKNGIENANKTPSDVYYGFKGGSSVKGTYSNGTWTHQ
jgi:hypothetical protein